MPGANPIDSIIVDSGSWVGMQSQTLNYSPVSLIPKVLDGLLLVSFAAVVPFSVSVVGSLVVVIAFVVGFTVVGESWAVTYDHSHLRSIRSSTTSNRILVAQKSEESNGRDSDVDQSKRQQK